MKQIPHIRPLILSFLCAFLLTCSAHEQKKVANSKYETNVTGATTLSANGNGEMRNYFTGPGELPGQKLETTKTNEDDERDRKIVTLLAQRITLNAQNLTLDQILTVLSQQTGANFIQTEDTNHMRFVLFLEAIPLQRALMALLEPRGLAFEQIPETNIFVIKRRRDTKPRVMTRIFRLHYQQIPDDAGNKKGGGGGKAAGGAKGGGGGKGGGDLGSLLGAIKGGGGGGGDKGGGGKGGAAKAGGGIVAAISGMLSEHGRIDTDAHTRSLIITDLPERFPMISEVIRQLDVRIPQILIEVEFIETNADAVRKLGIEWAGTNGVWGFASGAGRVLQFPSALNSNRIIPSAQDLAGVSLGDFEGNTATGVMFGRLSFEQATAVLKALESEADGKYLARPRILALNNKPAEIRLTSNTAIGATSSSGSAESTALVVSKAERSPTGITLKVTPQVNDENFVTLLLEPSVSRPAASTFFPGKYVDAQSRSLNTWVTVKNRETVSIGGLSSEEETELVRKVPFLGDIPLLGALFGYKERIKINKELIVFITPKILP